MTRPVPNVSPGYSAPSPARTIMAANGAITARNSDVVVTKGSVAALTLAAPTAAEDGSFIRVWTLGAHAHVITTPASGVNGANNTLTWTGAVGNFCVLRAYNGSWYMVERNGVAASTV